MFFVLIRNCRLLHWKYIAWNLVSEYKECSGNEIDKLLPENAEIQDCATDCEDISSMFIFSGSLNKCFCETSATAEGACHVIDNVNYHLYKYVNYGRLFII